MEKQPEQRPETKMDAAGAIVPNGPFHAAASDMLHEPPPHGPWGVQAVSDGTSPSGLSVSKLLRSKWLILGVFVAASVATVPWIWVFIAPKYQPRAVVRVAPVVPRIVFKTEDNGIVPLYRSYLNTQVSIIRSPAVLQRVLDQESIRRTSWYREAIQPASRFQKELRFLLGGQMSPLERLTKELSVRPRVNTELIDVSMAAKGAGEATVIVNAVVREYTKYSEETLREADIRRVETLVEKLTSLQKDIEGLIATRHNLSKRLGTGTPAELRTQLVMELVSLESDYERLEREHALGQWELESLIAAEKGTDGERDAGQANTESGVSDGRHADDPEWGRLNLALESVRHELELGRQLYGDSHPRIRQLTLDVAYAERLLKERQAQLDGQWANTPVSLATAPGGGGAVRSRAMLEWEIQVQEQQMMLLQKDIERQQSRVTQTGDVAKDIASYDEDIRRKRELYEAVRSRLRELEMEGKSPARISVAAEAIEPSKPQRDRRILLTAMALFGSLALGLGAGYIRTSTDPRIREAGEVQHAIRVPFLGQLPPLPTDGEMTRECNPVLTESVRMVRTALLERLAGKDNPVVLITSSSSRTGKTTLALLLARSLALLGKKTLLVEADFWKPCLSEWLAMDAKVGLAALLTGASDDDGAILSTGIPNLDIVLAGERQSEFNSEFLGNGVFASWLARWTKSYDFVLLDSPPVLPVADARILARQADGTIMVLRSAHSRRPDVIQAYADLSAAGGTLLGTVLVGVPSSSYAYYPEPQADDRGPRALKI